SIVAECEDKVIGFVSGFRQPTSLDTLFVWQVAIDLDFRGLGLATKLIEQLLKQLGDDVSYLEATVTQSNIPSSKLFKVIAERINTFCCIFECFSDVLFPGPSHEAELTYRVGPIK